MAIEKNKPLLSAQVMFRDTRLKTLVSWYKAATKQLIITLNSATDFSRARRISTLKQIDKILQGLDKKTVGWVQKEVKSYYQEHGQDAIKVLKADGFPVNTVFGLVDDEAVEALSGEIMTYYREAYSGVKRAAMRMLNESARLQIQALLAEGKITGATRKAISDRIAGELRKGFVALVDRGGRQWSIEAYSNMLTRTMLVKTSNQGMMNRLLRNGYDLVRVSDHLGSCPLCNPWQGQVLSMSGVHPDYPSVDKAKGEGLFHPNCRHRLLPYHEKLLDTNFIFNVNKRRYIRL